MSLKQCCILITFPTQLAYLRANTIVNDLFMCFQVAQLSKNLVALITCIWMFFFVNCFFMPRQTGLMKKCLITMVTSIWFFMANIIIINTWMWFSTAWTWFCFFKSIKRTVITITNFINFENFGIFLKMEWNKISTILYALLNL